MLLAKKSGNSVASHLTKQLVQNTLIDEGLRVVKEFSSQMNDGSVDLRVKSYDNFGSQFLASTLSQRTDSTNSQDNSGRSCKLEGPRPRGRPPKFLDREHQNATAFHNQFLHQQLLSHLATSQHLQNLHLAMTNTNGFDALASATESNINTNSNGFTLDQNSPKLSEPISSQVDLSHHTNDSPDKDTGKPINSGLML